MGIFGLLSYLLREHPLVTNMCLSTTVGFCGDIICQTIYEPASQSRPPLKREQLPSQSSASSLLVEMTSPSLYARRWYRERQERCDATAAAAAAAAGGAETITSAAASTPDSAAHSKDDVTVLVDLRRSMIFCSFTFMFGVPYFLYVYRVLDRYMSPNTITKKQALTKGFLSFIAAQVTNPIYVAYVTAMDHFFIFRDGRDGRRRVVEIALDAVPRNPMIFAGDEDESATEADSRVLDATVSSDRRPRSRSMFHFAFFSQTPQSRYLEEETALKMGNYYRFVDDKSFNFHEYVTCVSGDVRHKLTHDFPDMVRYGFVFWGCNWLPMFYYIPSHMRLTYSACLQVVWSGIMSHLMHRGNRLHLNHRKSREGHLAPHLVTNL